MPVYTKKSALESGMESLASVAAGINEAQMELRRRHEVDRNYDLDVAKFGENTRQFNASYSEGIRQFNERMDENTRQFDESLGQAEDHFSRNIEFQTEEGLQQRMVQREQIASVEKASLYRTRAQQETEYARITAQMQMDDSYVERLSMVGNKGEKLRTDTYTVIDETGQVRSPVKWDDTFETIDTLLKAGYGVPEEDGEYAVHAQDGIMDSLGFNPAHAIHGDTDGLYRAILEGAITKWKSGDTAAAIQMLGTFEDQNNRTYFNSRPKGANYVARAAKADGKGFSRIPITDTTANIALQQRIRDFAAYNFAGGTAEFNRLDPETQKQHMRSVYSDFNNVEQLRKQRVEAARDFSWAKTAGALQAEGENPTTDWFGGSSGGRASRSSVGSYGQQGDYYPTMSPVGVDRDGFPVIAMNNVREEYRVIADRSMSRLRSLDKQMQYLQAANNFPRKDTDKVDNAAQMTNINSAMSAEIENLKDTLGDEWGADIGSFYYDRASTWGSTQRYVVPEQLIEGIDLHTDPVDFEVMQQEIDTAKRRARERDAARLDRGVELPGEYNVPDVPGSLSGELPGNFIPGTTVQPGNYPPTQHPKKR